MAVILLYIVVIILQFCLSFFLFMPFDMFFEWIYTKGKSKGYKPSDILKEGMFTAKIIFLTGLVMLGVTIIINVYFMPLIGFYLSSFFTIYLGSSAVTHKYPKGRKIFENCWVTSCQIDAFIVTLNDHKILIDGERLHGKYDHVIYKEASPKWLPPHESDPVSGKDYEYMLQAVLKFLAKHRRYGVIQVPGEHIGPYFTKEDMINKYAQKGWNIERLPDGSTKVSPPQRKNLLTRIINLFSKKSNS